jgi:hypothetical protein
LNVWKLITSITRTYLLTDEIILWQFGTGPVTVILLVDSMFARSLKRNINLQWFNTSYWGQLPHQHTEIAALVLQELTNRITIGFKRFGSITRMNRQKVFIFSAVRLFFNHILNKINQ